jgi:hypothetical protein
LDLSSLIKNPVMKRLVVCFFYLFLSPFVWSNIPNNSLPQTKLKIGITGSIIYPGLNIGIERPYKYKQKDIVTSKRTKTKYKERLLAVNTGMYHQNDFHTGFLVWGEWIRKRHNSKGFFCDKSIGLGVNRTFVDGPTFEMDANGNPQKKHLSGNTYGLLSLSTSMGYQGLMMQNKAFSLYLKHQWIFMFPYNGFINPRPFIELGYKQDIQGIWNANPRFIHIKKSRKKGGNIR